MELRLGPDQFAQLRIGEECPQPALVPALDDKLFVDVRDPDSDILNA
jgi:hypothetical protein